MKIIATTIAVLFCLMGMAMDESNQSRLRREIAAQGFATFEDTKKSPFDDKELALILDLFDANCESGPDDKTVHRTSYFAEFCRVYSVKDGKLLKNYKHFPRKNPPEKDIVDLNFMFDRMLDIFTLPDGAKRVIVIVRILSDCESLMREGLERLENGQISELVVNEPEIPFHQDRFDDSALSFNFLYFQILSTEGFDEHYSSIGKVINEGQVAKYDSAIYGKESVELLAKIPNKKGSGYVVDQDAQPAKVHNRSPLSALITPSNKTLPHRKLIIGRFKVVKEEDLRKTK